ncbi:hypothetical protein AYI92_12775 [Shewanella xiamenensis]|uniref:DUF2235 domain-containing protein n=1 Tax=Shewanella xiamenensis TaxID=332186 RepID=UPI001185CA25|nr:DUF2235 domain-containing protein [Shewanella xiamenensis]TVL17638.1 hypothetical protein AYI90_13530 [Shewanella xiamenensis]TVL18312.1 hypothetical protein AYI91_12745 [Shewanella xiamenensis]TVL25260.1 hypothetical protein AYI92_12775 [Shewanella xiamenensis]TVL31283.1 hypothetical protein AYI93_13775 [Shewanella xiamenensis]TVP00686.1 hypothetical protein AYI89_13115 [Shewanella xiamenensis]
MNKRIVICADGTWNRPEKDLKVDFPTNVLRLARAISPMAADGKPQQVFYDWGVGSYYDEVIGGATGRGLHKNIMDGYRYIVQNYSLGDEIYLFGFSRGAYTVRCLCGLINNCGILKRPDARLIQQAFDHYKKSSAPFAPSGDKSVEFRQKHSHESREIKFVGVWDTVGAMGIPISFLGLFEDKDEFYDTKIGRNVRVARHALAIDEHRSDFEPTIWQLRDNMDMQQVWFAGAHSNIGGSYQPDKDGSLLSDNALSWMIAEAERFNLSLEPHLTASLHPNPLATLHDSRRSFYRIKQPYLRPLDPNVAPVLLHRSVKVRWEQDPKYRPKNLQTYLEKYGWPEKLID